MGHPGDSVRPRSVQLAGPDEFAGDPDAPVTRHKCRRTAVAAVAVVALLLTAIVFYQWGSAGSPGRSTTAAASPSASASKVPSTAQIYTAVAASVVSVEALHAGTTTTVDDPGTGDTANPHGTILT